MSGDAGGVWRTTDGGASWQDVVAPGLDTRTRSTATSRRPTSNHALLLAIGVGKDSKILRTSDGGATWTTTFVNDDPNAFYDCLAMWPGGRDGLAMSDPPDGKFRIIRTHDSGRTWSVVPNAGMPPAGSAEFGFAASGTCLVTAGHRDAFLASGGSDSRIYRSHDQGTTWKVVDSPIPPVTDAGGTFGLAFRNPRQGLAVGGNFLAPDDGTGVVGVHPRRWADLGLRWRPGWLPLGRRLGVRCASYGDRGRHERQRRDLRRRPQLDGVRDGPGRLRLGPVSPRRRVLGVGRGRPGRDAPPLNRSTKPDVHAVRASPTPLQRPRRVVDGVLQTPACTSDGARTTVRWRLRPGLGDCGDTRNRTPRSTS